MAARYSIEVYTNKKLHTYGDNSGWQLREGIGWRFSPLEWSWKHYAEGGDLEEVLLHAQNMTLTHSWKRVRVINNREIDLNHYLVMWQSAEWKEGEVEEDYCKVE